MVRLSYITIHTRHQLQLAQPSPRRLRQRKRIPQLINLGINQIATLLALVLGRAESVGRRGPGGFAGFIRLERTRRGSGQEWHALESVVRREHF